MKARKARKLVSLLLGLALVAGALSGIAMAAEEETYVLMNIPYGDFYAAELGADAKAVDAVTSATLNKPRTGTLAGGSYHVDPKGTDISGVIYPVLVKDPAVLEGLNKVDDTAKVEITVTNRGKESTTAYEGADALFEAPSYSYYVLSEKPAYYKELTVGEDGAFTFSAVGGRAATVEGVTGKVTYNGRHTAIEIVLSGMENVDTSAVSAVVLTTDDGAKYGLGHVTNLWRGTQLGWNLDEALAAIDGKTITNIRYITQTAVTDLPVEIPVRDAGTTGYYDIPKDAAYTDAVLWAKKAKITNGTGNGTFSPDATVDRATMVTFLWKQAGQPEPTTTENPFADVSESDWYYKAVLWAVENKVTDGTGKSTFSPKALVDRAQIMTFLWKAAGRPAATAEKALSDVADTAWYHDAAQWAAGQGLLSGDTLEPKATCTRAQVVELLYRSADK